MFLKLIFMACSATGFCSWRSGVMVWRVLLLVLLELASCLFALDLCHLEEILAKRCLVVLPIGSAVPLPYLRTTFLHDPVQVEQTVAANVLAQLRANSRLIISNGANSPPTQISSRALVIERLQRQRGCLLTSQQSVTKLHWSALQATSLDLVELVNVACRCYRTPEGGLSSAGIHRRYILDNIYRVELNGLCEERKGFPSQKDNFWRDYLQISKPVIFRGAVRDWLARRKWTNDWLRRHHGARQVRKGVVCVCVCVCCSPTNLCICLFWILGLVLWRFQVG